jgi:putative endonuclease
VVDMTTARQRLATGGYGEACAARHLVGQGMVVLDRNWRCGQGEVDLVLRDGAELVFCEVKTRTTAAFGAPLEAVTPVKLARLRRLGAVWMEEHAVRPERVRIDLVGVLLDASGDARIEHVRGVG